MGRYGMSYKELAKMIIKLNAWIQNDCTLGRLSFGDFQCFTLELPWIDNLTNISCIPAGEYKVTKYNSPSKGPVLLLHDVPNRSYVEIHSGNYTSQIDGCILVGDGIKYLDNDTIPDVTNSKNTLKELLKLVPDETTIKITRSS